VGVIHVIRVFGIDSFQQDAHSWPPQASLSCMKHNWRIGRLAEMILNGTSQRCSNYSWMTPLTGCELCELPQQFGDVEMTTAIDMVYMICPSQSAESCSMLFTEDGVGIHRFNWLTLTRPLLPSFGNMSTRWSRPIARLCGSSYLVSMVYPDSEGWFV